MSDVMFEVFTKQILTLSYDQTIVLMGKLLESLKTKKTEENYEKLVNSVVHLISDKN